MRVAFVFICVFAVLSGACAAISSESDEDECSVVNCVGEEYQCLNDNCYCATGYVLNPFHTACIKCPGRGESCYGPCCSQNSTTSLYCWQGVCQTCYDQHGVWTCRDSLDRILLVSVTQVAMATALVLGIIATFVLLYKFCAVPDSRSINNGGSSRLSIGSLQIYVDERLRDAPPRYTRSAPSGSSITPPFFVNVGFIHDSSVPPPPYSAEAPEIKDEETSTNNSNTPTLHI